MKMVLPIVNVLALIATVLVSYLGNAGIFNGNTMATISARYANLFTPAGYAFSIWGIIYLGLAGFVVYAWRSLYGRETADPDLSKVSRLFLATCLANSAWVVTWLNDFTGISVLIMVVLLMVVLRIVSIVHAYGYPTALSEKLFVQIPFALYAGWVSVALIANMAAWLTKVNWDGWGISAEKWAVFMIFIAALLNVLMVTLRQLPWYGVVGVWALLAIAVANNQPDGSHTVVYACYIAAVAVLVSILIHVVRRRAPRKKSSFR